MNGIIVKALSGFYYLNSGGNIYECRARGSFRKSGISPLVGDKAEFELSGGTSGVVTEILPRKNALSRPPVANIDKLFIVSAYENPEPNAYVIDKITAIAEYADIEPIIVFNKCDTGDFGSWERIYRHAGFKVYTVSAETGEGLAALKEELKNSVSAFTGNSGVGKSSILNALFGGHILKTGDVSEKLESTLQGIPSFFTWETAALLPIRRAFPRLITIPQIMLLKKTLYIASGI